MLQFAVNSALTMEAGTWEVAARAAFDTTFPIDNWSLALEEQYLIVLAYDGKMTSRAPSGSSRPLRPTVAVTTDGGPDNMSMFTLSKSARASAVQLSSTLASSKSKSSKLASTKSSVRMSDGDQSGRSRFKSTSFVGRLSTDIDLQDITHRSEEMGVVSFMERAPFMNEVPPAFAQALSSVHHSSTAAKGHDHPHKGLLSLLSLLYNDGASPNSASAPAAKPASSGLKEMQNVEVMDTIVEERTIRELFLSEGTMSMEHIVNEAYAKSLIALQWESPITRFLATSVMGMRLQDAILCALCLFVPIGSIALVAVPYYSNPGAWQIAELAGLFATHAMCTGIAHFCWLKAATVTRIPRLLCLASLFQFSVLPILYIGTDPNQKGALFVLAVLHGVAAGAVEPLYLGFAFLDAWTGEIAVAAKRMALVEPGRTMVQFLVIGLLALTIPHEHVGFAYETGQPSVASPSSAPSLPISVQVIFILLVSITSILGGLTLWLPIPEDFRLPSVPLNIHLYGTYMWLILAECVMRLGGFLDVAYLTWFLLAGFPNNTIANFFFTTGAVTACAAVLFCLVFSWLTGGARITLATVALCIFPPSIIGALGIASAPCLHSSSEVMTLLALALVLSKLKQMATSLLKLFSLPSRWKYLTLQAHSALVLYSCEALSPLLLLGLSKAWDLPLTTTGEYAKSDVFAHSTFLLSLPFTLVYFVMTMYVMRMAVLEGIVPWYARLERSGGDGGSSISWLDALMRMFQGPRKLRGKSNSDDAPDKMLTWGNGAELHVMAEPSRCSGIQST